MTSRVTVHHLDILAPSSVGLVLFSRMTTMLLVVHILRARLLVHQRPGAHSHCLVRTRAQVRWRHRGHPRDEGLARLSPGTHRLVKGSQQCTSAQSGQRKREQSELDATATDGWHVLGAFGGESWGHTAGGYKLAIRVPSWLLQRDITSGNYLLNGLGVFGLGGPWLRQPWYAK